MSEKLFKLSPICIHVLLALGISNEKGEITRVVGNTLVYAKFPSGSIAFVPEDIENYHGESLSSLGIKKGAEVYASVY